jgi:hypothetical protein
MIYHIQYNKLKKESGWIVVGASKPPTFYGGDLATLKRAVEMVWTPSNCPWYCTLFESLSLLRRVSNY